MVSWTQEEVDVLVKMWTAGKSMGNIAKVLPGRTRNSVATRIRTMGIKRNQDIPYNGKARIVLKRGKRKNPKRKNGRVDVAAVDRPDKQFTLADLKRNQCHFPIGDPKHDDFTFCGAHTDTYPYCDAHKEIAHTGRVARGKEGWK